MNAKNLGLQSEAFRKPARASAPGAEMVSKQYAIRRRTAHIQDYLRYKFPVLGVFSGRTKWLFLPGVALLSGGAAYYAWRVPSPTPNSVLDGLVATPLQLVIVTALVAGLAWLRVRFYRGAKGTAERNRVDHPSADSYPWLGLPHELREVSFDCADIGELRELHPFVESAIRFTDFDREDNFRLEAGTLNIPKCSLLSLHCDGEQATLRIGSTSFYAVYYSHYFADYRLSRDSTDENSRTRSVSLRTVYGPSVDRFLRSQIPLGGTAGGVGSFDLRPHPVLPNPLGVTGVCYFTLPGGERVFIARHRGANVINEAMRLDWSFSGLVEAHPFFRADRAHIGLAEFVGCEMTDELLQPLREHARRISGEAGDAMVEPRGYRALGVLFNGKYLFQPELVVLVELDVSEGAIQAIQCYAEQSRQIRLLTQSRLAEQAAFGPAKDLFLPIRERLLQWLRAEDGEPGSPPPEALAAVQPGRCATVG